jgi:hypothetical protein
LAYNSGYHEIRSERLKNKIKGHDNEEIYDVISGCNGFRIGIFYLAGCFSRAIRQLESAGHQSGAAASASASAAIARLRTAKGAYSDRCAGQ